MKKFFFVLLLLIVLINLTFLFTGCDTNATNNSNESSESTNSSTESNNNTQNPHEHNFNYVVTSPTCTQAGYTTFSCDCGTIYKDDYKDATGHIWNEATCITPKMCPICKTTVGEPEGHSFVEGECIYCFEEDPDFIVLELTASKNNIHLDNSNEVIYITMIGGETVTFDIGDPSVVDCEWGEWNGDIIPLTLTPISSGETIITISIEGYDKSLILNVSTDVIETTLTIDELGKEYKYYPSYGSLTYNVNVINSATYTVDTGHLDYDGTINITVDLIVSMIEYNTNYGYIDIDYELYDENDVCVETGNLYIDMRYIGRAYEYSITFFDLEPGHYLLKFYDTYN